MLLRPNSLKKIVVDKPLYYRLKKEQFLKMAHKQNIKVVKLSQLAYMDYSDDESISDSSVVSIFSWDDSSLSLASSDDNGMSDWDYEDYDDDIDDYY